MSKHLLTLQRNMAWQCNAYKALNMETVDSWGIPVTISQLTTHNIPSITNRTMSNTRECSESLIIHYTRVFLCMNPPICDVWMLCYRSFSWGVHHCLTSGVWHICSRSCFSDWHSTLWGESKKKSTMTIGCRMLFKEIASSHSGCLICMSKCGAWQTVVDIPSMWTIANNWKREDN
jgi:hypothetical protein